MKLEQASKVVMWMPTRHANGEGSTDREEPGAGTRYSSTNEHLIRSTGVLSTACREGDLRSVREARDWLRVAARTSPERVTASLGVGEGHKTVEAG